MLFQFLVTLTLAFGLVGATAKPTTINSNSISNELAGNNEDAASSGIANEGGPYAAMQLQRRAQSNNDIQYFEIEIDISVDPTDISTQVCDLTTQILIQNEINLLFLDHGVGDLGNGEQQICKKDPGTAIIRDPNNTGPWGYVYLGGGPCLFCGGHDNRDGRRMLTTTAAELRAAFTTYITTTLVPNYPSCFGTSPTIQVDVKEETESIVNGYCNPIISNESTPTQILPPQWEYERPAWWATVEKEDKHLTRCIKKEHPPTNGSTCAARTKSCYWGEQKCPPPAGSDKMIDYPTTKCACDGIRNQKKGTWTCEDATCPV